MIMNTCMNRWNMSTNMSMTNTISIYMDQVGSVTKSTAIYTARSASSTATRITRMFIRDTHTEIIWKWIGDSKRLFIG